MKILELTNFSAGICGVFARVKEESLRLSKDGHKVKIFSSNLEKGTNKQVSSNDALNGIEITRFPAKKLGGESFMSWNFAGEALKFQPDIIIAHSYRHPHTLKALKIAKILKGQGKTCKVFLVTHAPFARSSSRSFTKNIMVKTYDQFIGKRKINQFDKVIAITKWEIPFLEKLGLDKNRIAYIPNGLPEQFFKQKPQKQEKQKKNKTQKILFLGRISPIKSIETLIKAIPLLKKDIKVEIVGPHEWPYLYRLKTLTNDLNLNETISFSPPVYDLNEKIKKIDECSLFVLPSISEGMPQSLIEAMARKKLVISSDNLASKDIIQDSKNGFLFKTKDERSLAIKINHVLEMKPSEIIKIQTAAQESVKQFSWQYIIEKIENLF